MKPLPTLASPHLLLVEREPLLRAALTLALQVEGFVVHAAEDGASGLALLRDGAEIGMGVLEIDLGPGLDGFALAAEARRLRPAFLAVFLTGRMDLLVGRSDRAQERHLLKPCPVARVAATLRAMLGLDGHGGFKPVGAGPS